MKKFICFLGMLPLFVLQVAFGQTNVTTTGSANTSVTPVFGNANAGAGEDTSAGGTANRISVQPKDRAAASQGNVTTAAPGSADVVVTGGNASTASTGTTAVSGTAAVTGTNSSATETLSVGKE